MARFVEALMSGKTRVVIPFFLALVPIVCIAYLTLPTDFHWWPISKKLENGLNLNNIPLDRDHVENLKYQLENIACPAKEGLGLKDYWSCLWSHSITAEGLQHDKTLKWQYYLDQVNAEQMLMESWFNKTVTGPATVKKQQRQRKRRSTFQLMQTSAIMDSNPKPRLTRQVVSSEDNFTLDKAQSLLQDLYIGFNPSFRSELKSCQQQINPGISIQEFLTCVRKISFDSKLDHKPGGFANSFNPIFEPTSLPLLDKSIYDEHEFSFLKLTDRTNETYKFIVEFQPLGDEEKLDNFFAADPYFYDHWSPYRYRYNSLNERQRQPGWSYRGLNGAKEWHKLSFDNFLLPLKDKVDFKKTSLMTEFAQTYPGVGELVDSLKGLEVENPMAVRWNKDSGGAIYTRYLLPLLAATDLEYYKTKGLIESSVQAKSDAEQIQDIIDRMSLYKNMSSDWLAKWDDQSGSVTTYNDKQFPTWKDVPFAEAYRRIITQFFDIDTATYIQAKTQIFGQSGDYLYAELEIIRWLMRAYVDAVIGQETCLKEMVSVSGDSRVENVKDLFTVLFKADTSNECKTAYNLTEAIQANLPDDMEYKVTHDALLELYNRYYEMKEARERYSLPKYPIEFPICKHNDPSPINIETQSGRQSTIRDYTFGEAAYRLNRFFMFFPLDGSPLLTLGIVDGERLDGTAVPLKGGAVRGQFLTFQYMHIRFGIDWKSVGSEHWINGEGAQMELQMVFTAAGSADSIKYWHILARIHNRMFQFREKLVIVLSVLVNVLETDEAVVKKIKTENLKQDPYLFEPLAQAAYHFRKIPEKFPDYEQPRGYVSVDPVFRIVDFIPATPNYFYTYRGSLSWPPCFAYVIWSVFNQRLYMSKRQFDEFAQIPHFGVHVDNFAHSNIRKFEEIYVEEENEPGLENFKIENMVKQRTAERLILTGWHDPLDEAEHEHHHDSDHREEGVVGDDVYYMDMIADSKGATLVTFDRAEMCALIVTVLSVLSI